MAQWRSAATSNRQRAAEQTDEADKARAANGPPRALQLIRVLAGQMLSLEDPPWSEMEGGYRLPLDPRPMLLNLQSSVDVDGAWADLWQELHHQGDVGVASYAAVPHLVRIHRERGVVDWNTYALVATIELARDARSNPPMPTWLAEGYDHAIQEMAEIGYRDLRTACGSGLVRSILGILAIAKGARSHGRILSLFSEDEVLELEKHFYGEPE